MLIWLTALYLEPISSKLYMNRTAFVVQIRRKFNQLNSVFRQVLKFQNCSIYKTETDLIVSFKTSELALRECTESESVSGTARRVSVEFEWALNVSECFIRFGWVRVLRTVRWVSTESEWVSYEPDEFLDLVKCLNISRNLDESKRVLQQSDEPQWSLNVFRKSSSLHES